jgi:3-methyladenine DNA glycosylase AlkD
MNDIARIAKEELAKLNFTDKGEHLKTGDIRRLSAELYRSLEDKSRDKVFAISGELLEERIWPLKVIAFDFAYRVRKQYDEKTFSLFENWLVKYVQGWGDCDDFCTHAFGELIVQNTELAKKTLVWTERGEFWMRRAAAVVLIPSINRGKYKETDPIAVSERLLLDSEDLVRKGYGWMLKVLSVKEPQLVYDYLEKNKEIMPRVSFRYALEKMDKERKSELMR